jgi:hypothetical protein
MKIFFLMFFMILFSVEIYAQSHLEWKRNGSGDGTTTVEGLKVGTVENQPEVNINWEFPGGSGGAESNVLKYYRFMNDGNLWLRHSADGSSYSNIIRFSGGSIDTYVSLGVQGSATFNGNTFFKNDVLFENSSVSVGHSIPVLCISPYRFQVKGASNLIGDFNVTGNSEFNGNLDVQNGFSVTGQSTFTGAARHNNRVELSENNYLEFGWGVEKQNDAGKIGYQLWTQNLDIVGAGEEAGERGVRLWDKVTIGNRNNGPHSDAELHVNGKIAARRVIVTAHNWSDYVFEDGYQLRDIQELDDFIKENGHLPNIPSTNDVKESGIDVADMNRLLLEKIEELSLYVIDLQKQIDDLSK